MMCWVRNAVSLLRQADSMICWHCVFKMLREVCLAVKWQCWEQVWELLSVIPTVKQKWPLLEWLDSQMLFDHTIFPSSGGYKQCSRTLSGSEEGTLPPSCGQLLNTSMVIVTYTRTVAVVCLLCTNDKFLHAYNYLYTYVKIRAYCIMLHLHFAAVFCYCIHHDFETLRH